MSMRKEIGATGRGGAACRLSVALLAVAVLASGCATKRPVLYPNQHLQQVGDAAAKRDIEECMELASSADLEKSQAGEAAKSTATGAAVGGAAGAASGAILGAGAGRGAAAGAAVGGIGGLARGLFSASDPDPLYKSYVNTCLSERGYRTIGWK